MKGIKTAKIILAVFTAVAGVVTAVLNEKERAMLIDSSVEKYMNK